MSHGDVVGARQVDVPDPPAPESLPIITLGAGTTWHNVGPVGARSVFHGSPNPARFTPVHSDPARPGEVLPVAYLADSPEGAVAETILRHAVTDARIPQDAYRGRVLRTVELERDLRLAWLHSGGLIAARVDAYCLTDTAPGPATYARTRLWGQAAHEAGLDGLVWMSRLWNTSQALLLFGDRTDDPATLTVWARPTRDFATRRDVEWLREHGRSFGVTFL